MQVYELAIFRAAAQVGNVAQHRAMSYDITLYRRDFLKRAIEANLGDWSGADPIPDDAMRALIAAVEAAGFIRSPVDPGFTDFAKQEGFDPGMEFNLDTPTLLAQLTVFPGEVAFSIPYSDPRTHASVDFCNQIARRLAAEHELGFNDPQIGEAIYEWDES